MPAIFDFRSERVYLFLIYTSPWCFLPSFESIGLSVQGLKSILYGHNVSLALSVDPYKNAGVNNLYG